MTLALPSLPCPLARRLAPGGRPGGWPEPGALPDADPSQPPIELGTAVRVSLSGGWAVTGMTEEGVVIEIVPPGGWPRSDRVLPARCTRSSVARYVVQCWSCRVLRSAAEMVVVCR